MLGRHWHAYLARYGAGKMRDIASTKLKAGLGMLGALHTWSRQLIYHPQVHYIVASLGLSDSGSPVIPKDSEYLLCVKVLGVRFRSRMRSAPRTRHPHIRAKVPAAAWRKDGVVHSEPVGTGKAALTYLSRYIHRTAISSQRRVRPYGWLSPAANRKYQRLRIPLGGDSATADQPPMRTPACGPTAVFCQRCQRPMNQRSTMAARGASCVSGAKHHQHGGPATAGQVAIW